MEPDGSADGLDEAEAEQRFACCKPLAPVESERWHGGDTRRIGRIFYGNDTFFTFFRLHQHLYFRRATQILLEYYANIRTLNPSKSFARAEEAETFLMHITHHAM